MEYQDFAPLKFSMGAVFVEAWDLYTKQVTNNLIMPSLYKYSTEKLATAATENAQMEIDSETTADRRQLQDLFIFNLEETKNLRQGLHRIKDYINTMKQQQQQQHGGKTQHTHKNSNKTKNVKGKIYSGKKRQNKEHRQHLRKNKKCKGIDSDKNKKYQLDYNSGGRGRVKGPTGGRNNASIGGRVNRGRSTSSESSQRSKRIS